VKKTDRTFIPWLPGDHLLPDEIRRRSQEFFLISIWNVTPTPLYSLRDDIFDKYRMGFAFEQKRGRENDEIRRIACDAIVDLLWRARIEGVESHPQFQAAVKKHRLLYEAAAALIDWSTRFNLRGKRPEPSDIASDAPATSTTKYNWPLVAAVETIFWWYFQPAGWLFTARNPPSWRPPSFDLRPPKPEILPPIPLRSIVFDPPTKATKEIDTPGWYIELEPECSFRDRIMKDFKRWLDTYVSSRRQSAQSAGLVPGPGKRDLQHFIWAAKYQVGGLSYTEIAKEHKKRGTHVTDDAVENAVKKLLDLIHLERRPPRRGPKGLIQKRPAR
jgi:hypothetical protein